MSNLFQFPEVIVVEASAGSGKTYALAKRYVQLALVLAGQHNVPIQSILAITFTNKATWEMKSRILDFLKRIALKQLKSHEVQDILLPVGINEDKASGLAFSLMEEVIYYYHYFQVQTIDSFINALLSSCSFKIGLSARFKIQRNFLDYLQLALDELLDRSHSDKKIHQLFENFIRQYLFLENRWGWFPKEDLLDVMTVLFRPYNTYQKPLTSFNPGVEEVFAKKRNIYALIRKLQPLCPPQTHKRFLTHVQDFLQTHDGIFDVDELKPYWAQDEFPVNKDGAVTAEVRKLWNQLRQDIHDLCWLESRTMFNAYIELFDTLLDHFYELSRRDDVLFLEELNRKAASLFDNDLVTVQELYLRLAARLQHYLIDEFQDTSLAQWRNLSSMVQEALAGRGSLFYVGDKKQAIYAFRGGESRLFDALQSQLADYVQIQNLDKNYRSGPNIIEFNNGVFNLENLRAFLDRKYEDDKEHKRDGVYFSDEDFGHIVNAFGAARQSPGKDLTGGIVRVEHLSGRTKSEYSEEARTKLVALIQQLQQRFALKDIAILTRSNQELEEITQWFWKEGIYAQSERNSDIKNNPLVAELIAFLTFLNSPIDNNTFAQFCLGELLPKASGLSPEVLRNFLFESARQRDSQKDLYFYKLFRDAFPQVWEDYFEPFFRQVGVYPLYELTAGLLARFRCEELFPKDQGFVIHLLQLVKMHEEQSCDLADFLDYYDQMQEQERFVPMPQAEAVHILTVHKAKGLEFPVVVIPFLEMDIKVGSGGRDGAQSYLLDVQEQGISLVRLKESYRRFCPELQARYEAEYKKALFLELNIVYVALTRAIEEMYVFIPQRSGHSINAARFLIPEECFHMGTPAQRPRTHQPVEPYRKISHFVDDQWLPKLKEEFLLQKAISVSAAYQGEVIHELLSQIGNLSQAKVNIEPEVQPIVTAPNLKKFFYLPLEAQVFCEKEFVNAFGDTRRIDRLMVQPRAVWVVDYKTSRLGQEQHKEQMRGYMDLIKAFYPAHTIEGYLIYLDELQVEQVIE